MIPVHNKPNDSERELDELFEVFLAVWDKWKTEVSLGAQLKSPPIPYVDYYF